MEFIGINIVVALLVVHHFGILLIMKMLELLPSFVFFLFPNILKNCFSLLRFGSCALRLM